MSLKLKEVSVLWSLSPKFLDFSEDTIKRHFNEDVDQVATEIRIPEEFMRFKQKNCSNCDAELEALKKNFTDLWEAYSILCKEIRHLSQHVVQHDHAIRRVFKENGKNENGPIYEPSNKIKIISPEFQNPSDQQSDKVLNRTDQQQQQDQMKDQAEEVNQDDLVTEENVRRSRNSRESEHFELHNHPDESGCSSEKRWGCSVLNQTNCNQKHEDEDIEFPDKIEETLNPEFEAQQNPTHSSVYNHHLDEMEKSLLETINVVYAVCNVKPNRHIALILQEDVTGKITMWQDGTGPVHAHV